MSLSSTSYTLHEAIDVPDLGIGDHQYPPHSGPTPAPKKVPNFVDGSGPIFSMYLEMAEEEDKKMVEGWKADADGILIFTGLFSAAVASLTSVSIQDIRPNPQDTSNFYLANIYQTMADPNRSNSSLPSSPPAFSPPKYAVWVNSLWFLSLVISLTCALLATLLQQWARRYLKATQPRYGPHKRARIRAFFFEGVEKFLLPWAVEALPTLLHVSLSLFFAGLVVFLCNVHLTVFSLVLSWVGACTALYGCITIMPLFRHDCPYSTPLTSLAWPIVTGISYVVFRVLRWLTWSVFSQNETFRHFSDLKESSHKMLLQGMLKTAEATARKSSSEIDARAFMWTFESLDEDHELERFFAGLPGFRSSRVVGDPLLGLTPEQKWKLVEALIGLLDRTFSSELLPERVKNRRAVICANAIDPTDIPGAFWWVLRRIASEDQYGPVLSAEIAHFVRDWGSSKDVKTTMLIRAIVSGVVARAQRRDNSWFNLASNELGVPESTLRDYAAHGDSLSLSILIHITRQQFIHIREWTWPHSKFSGVLQAASIFNVQDTSPELQHEFCALWNQIVLMAQKDDGFQISFYILGPIRNVYIALHRGTDAAPTQFSTSTSNRDQILYYSSSYPLCNIPDHLPRGHDVSSLSTFAGAIPHDNAALSPCPSSSGPNTPSSSVYAPLHVLQNHTDVPPLDDDICVPRSFHPAHRTTLETLRIPVTPPDPATVSAISTSRIAIPHPSPETSTSAPPLSTTSPPATVYLRRNPDPPVPSDAPNLSSLASSNPILDNILPTDPPVSSHSSITRSNLSLSCPDSHRPALVTTALDASPGPTSGPGLGAAAEDDDRPKGGLRKEKDALESPLANRAIRANNMVSQDPPPRSPSLPSVTDSDVAASGPSWLETNAERTGDYPPHPSHCRYDVTRPPIS